jgi:long-chain acyl-CoA synthetase
MKLLHQHGNDRPDPVNLSRSDVALLCYTSGTTGRPKAAMNTHGNVTFASQVFRSWLRLGDGDAILGVFPLFHIAGLIAHITVAWVSGVSLILFYRYEPGVAMLMIERWRPTFVIGSITAFLAMLDHPDLETRDFSSLTKVFTGGAPIAPATVQRFRSTTGLYIHNTYGLTESTSPALLTPMGLEAPTEPDTGALALGVPVPSTDVRVVSVDSGQEVAPGEVGEFWIRGPQVVPGYWQDPGATQATFTDGFLRTGDVGKRDEAGWFYLLDRAKDMINVAGYKVWPREVEDFLYQHPAIREAAVVGLPDPYRGETVKAFVALKSGQRATPEELIDFCRQRMATYKVSEGGGDRRRHSEDGLWEVPPA